MYIPLSNVIRVKTLDVLRRTNQLKIYKEYIKNQFQYTKEDIERYQKKRFKEVFYFHYHNNPHYRRFLDTNNFKLNEKYFNIESIPLMSKDFIKKNIDGHSVQKEIYKTKHTSGTTGTPTTYHLSKDSLEGMWPAVWRAFHLYEVQPCDRLMMIAGHSLFNNRTVKRKIYDHINNFNVVPAFDLSDEILERAYRTILKKKIKAIYAYTSAALLFLQFLKNHGYRLQLKAIFTTAETFIPSLRPLAREYCSCDVIDTYGANDGGVQAFECEYHEGYHLNFERCMVEIMDGQLVLTDLLNRATPFIRYRVGDCTSSKETIKDKCDCGRSLFRINDVTGRINQYIEDIDSTKIHTAFFNQLFAPDLHIFQFQVTQKAKEIYVNIIHDNFYNDHYYVAKYSDTIRKRIKMPTQIVFDEPIRRLDNMKVPVFWTGETNKI